MAGVGRRGGRDEEGRGGERRRERDGRRREEGRKDGESIEGCAAGSSEGNRERN